MAPHGRRRGARVLWRQAGAGPQRQQKQVAVVAPKEPQGDAPVFVSQSTQDWLHPDCDGFRGMRVSRPQSWEGLQGHVDHLDRLGVMGITQMLREIVSVPAGSDPAQPTLEDVLASASQRLTKPLQRCGLPANIIRQVHSDVQEVGTTVSRLLPAARKLDLKVETVGENCCLRWHQDKYVARAIITYNCGGTEYIGHEHVNLWELHNCGNNACIVADASHIDACEVGDILFIKGSRFPAGLNGLVHKSPAVRRHSDGSVMTRLCLKVDVPEIPDRVP